MHRKKKKKPTTLFCSPRFTLTAEHKAQVMQYLSRVGQRSQQGSVPLLGAASYSAEKSQNHAVEKEQGISQECLHCDRFFLIMGKKMCMKFPPVRYQEIQKNSLHLKKEQQLRTMAKDLWLPCLRCCHPKPLAMPEGAFCPPELLSVISVGNEKLVL